MRPVIRSPLSLLTILLAGNAAAQTGPVDFTREVRPLLSRHCFACHGPDAEAREADLSLVDFESATRELAPDIFAIVPGDPDSSELWRRITDAGDPMPPTSAHDELEDSERPSSGGGSRKAPVSILTGPMFHRSERPSLRAESRSTR